MANPEHLETLRRGVEAWNRWRRESPETIVNLIGADLEGSQLVDVDFERKSRSEVKTEEPCHIFGQAGVRRTFESLESGYVDLSNANLQSAQLYRARCQGAKLRDANLKKADLRYANFYEADLRNADLSQAKLNPAFLGDADLRGAILSGANLTSAEVIGTNLSGAQVNQSNFARTKFEETILADVDLTLATGLETCEHLGPSILDIQTLVGARHIPQAFLLGCGLPKSLIDFLPSLLEEPVQFYSCFISYSAKDQDFAERLHADLQARGIRCWFGSRDVRGGQKVHEQIQEAIGTYDRLLLILSRYSMNSEWVKTEIASAREKELRGNRRVLFPISVVPFDAIRDWNCFDADIGKDSAREIREYFIPDFSNWKNDDSYREAFQRLLRDLGVEDRWSTALAARRSKLPTTEELAALPRWARVAFAARCAGRVKRRFLGAWPEAPPEDVSAVERAVALAERAAPPSPPRNRKRQPLPRRLPTRLQMLVLHRLTILTRIPLPLPTFTTVLAQRQKRQPLQPLQLPTTTAPQSGVLQDAHASHLVFGPRVKKNISPWQQISD